MIGSLHAFPGPHEPFCVIPASTPPEAELRRLPGVLRHLRRLTNAFAHEGQEIAYIHIYSRRPGQQHGENLHDLAPPLDTFFAQNSGPEGISCVDRKSVV